MSHERYSELLASLCEAIALPDPAAVLARGWIEVEGFEVLFSHYDNDAEAMYLQVHYGIVTQGRTLQVYQMLLEANLTVYAQDQAQLGINPETSGIVLIVRVPMTDDVDGTWLAETLAHYAEHGRYWANNLLQATEEIYEGVCNGDYFWLRI